MKKRLTTNEDVYALLHARAASAALGAAITTGLLWMLAEKPMTDQEIVQALNIPGKRGYYWLQYLESFGVLETTPQGYAPTAVLRATILSTFDKASWQHLVIDQQEKDGCVHGLPQFISEPGSLWTAQGLKGPINYVNKMRNDPARARDFTRMLFQAHSELAEEVASFLDLSRIERLLDLGGSSGGICMPLLRKYPALTVTVVDIENVCIAGREVAQEQGFADRISYQPIEFDTDEFPSDFDAMLQCDVGAFSLELLQKIWRCLKPGGLAIFVELFSLSETQLPPARLEWTFLDSLHDPNFIFRTVEGFKAELMQTGFDVVNQHQLRGGLIAIQARKR